MDSYTDWVPRDPNAPAWALRSLPSLDGRRFVQLVTLTPNEEPITGVLEVREESMGDDYLSFTLLPENPKKGT